MSARLSSELAAALAALLVVCGIVELGRGLEASRRLAALVRGVLARAETAWLAALAGRRPRPRDCAAVALAGSLAGAPFALSAGTWALVPLAALATLVASFAVAGVRARAQRREFDAEAAAFAAALADALGAGHALRSAVREAATGVRGALRHELSLTAARLERGAPTDEALEWLRARCPSPRVATVVAACLVQQRVGGDLPALLRECARTFAAGDRLLGEALAATAQARFTGFVVAALPLAGALLTEIASPGYLTGLASDAVTGPLLAIALLLQLAGLLAIRKLARVGEPV
ncbi:type II secretion system F family protein [Thermoleophilum album]|uniref:Tight adherence protein B n=1 Tax=Thermoleophilum album TaxID=29539 RepID=A0A1H6G0E5_THEAL|nr:type II secretion system F family protein [Thermoleophilum album]SEH15375.1 tight adherence protein B [Thermoleophilum album]